MKELFKGPELCRNCGCEFRNHSAKNKACPQNGNPNGEYRRWSETQTFEPQDQNGAAIQNREPLTSLAKVGITALVDEATGFQQVRGKGALKKKLNSYLRPKEASPMSEKRKRYHVEFDIDIPGDVRPAQVENWIRSRCGDKGKLRRDNPLYAETLDPIYGTFKVTPGKKTQKSKTEEIKV
jgi:hypothetical protein